MKVEFKCSSKVDKRIIEKGYITIKSEGIIENYINGIKNFEQEINSDEIIIKWTNSEMLAREKYEFKIILINSAKQIVTIVNAPDITCVKVYYNGNKIECKKIM